jgi:hypothetical protein
MHIYIYICYMYVFIYYIYIVGHNYSIYIPQSLSELIRQKILPKGMVKLALSFVGHSRGASLQVPVS